MLAGAALTLLLGRSVSPGHDAASVLLGRARHGERHRDRARRAGTAGHRPPGRRLHREGGRAPAGGRGLRPRARAGPGRGADARPGHAPRHQHQHARAAQAVPGGGHALPGVGAARAGAITIFFDHEIRLSRYDSENQQGLFDRIHAAKGGGDTALYDAIAVYLSRVEGASGRKVLVLFTDGEDSRSELTLPEVMRLLRSSRRGRLSDRLPGSFAPGSSRAVRSRAVLQQFAGPDGRPGLQPVAVARPGRHLPEDPGRAGRAVRAGLRVGQPEAGRQAAPPGGGAVEPQGPEGPPPHRLHGQAEGREPLSPSAPSSSSAAPARAAASAAPAASRTPRWP